MNNQLKEKLREIVIDIVFKALEGVSDERPSDFVEQIDKAYKDEGYRHVHSEHRSGKEVIIAEEKIGMTGQEFYDRFHEEKIKLLEEALDNPMWPNEINDLAAKRAAGISEASDE
jgi:hypothetical protein